MYKSFFLCTMIGYFSFSPIYAMIPPSLVDSTSLGCMSDETHGFAKTQEKEDIEQFIQYLIEQGKDLNQNEPGPLFWTMSFVCNYNLNDSIRLLLKHGANPNSVCSGNSVLYYAILSHAPESTLTLLIQHGADVNKVSVSGCTPLMQACRQGDSKLVRFLLKHEANVNIQNINGNTAFHELVNKAECVLKKPEECKKIVQLLCNANVQMEVKNHDNQTVIELGVVRYGMHNDFVKFVN